MPEKGKKTRQAWDDLRESWQMIVALEKEGLKLTAVEADRSYDQMKEQLRQATVLLRKRRNALRRYMIHKKRGD